MPEIILITLAKNLFRILKNEVRNKKKIRNQKKNRKGGVHPPINPSPIKNLRKQVHLGLMSPQPTDTI